MLDRFSTITIRRSSTCAKSWNMSRRSMRSGRPLASLANERTFAFLGHKITHFDTKPHDGMMALAMQQLRRETFGRMAM